MKKHLFRPGALILILVLFALSNMIGIAARPKTISFWHYWTGVEGDAIQKIVDEFNQTHKDFQVKTVPYNDYDKHHQELLSAINNGKPPDVSVVGGDYLPEWVAGNALVSLDGLIKKTGFGLGNFYAPSLRIGSVGGRIYGLALTMDTYALLWNKALFVKAGLDPEKPPRTIAELDAMAAKLTVKKADGSIQQLGFLPNWPWGHFPMIAWAFGGSLSNAASGKITANDPNTAAALAWEAQYYERLGRNELSAFRYGFGFYQTSGNAFYTGQVAIMIDCQWQPTFIRYYAPKDFKWGAAPFPGLEDTPRLYGQTRVNATCLCIPSGSKNQGEAWEFISWLERPERVGRFNAVTLNVPPFRSLGRDPNYTKDPRFTVFMQLLENPNLQVRPEMPLVNRYLGELGLAEQRAVVLNDRTPRQALNDVQRTIQAELDKVKTGKVSGK